ncbi:MAG: DUF1273 domain-containing protein [Kiritimatiellaeota bacterium]|nr:DUF1273 domain-containing protein [Kiritimatiellota bacterium]
MSATRETTCCFTGHRELPADKIPEIKKRLEAAVRSLLVRGVRNFVAGGAVGFDMLAAEVVLGLRCEFPEIKLELALPFPEQAKNWKTENDRETYDRILKQADAVVCVSPEHTARSMMRRNRYLVDSGRYCIAYITSEHSGTANTVNYAKQNGLEIINLAAGW